jgi:hypothetical protein
MADNDDLGFIRDFVKKESARERKKESRRAEARRRADEDSDNRPIPNHEDDLPPDDETRPPPWGEARDSNTNKTATDPAYQVHWHGEPDDRQLQEWLVENLIPKVGTGLISGQWGTYKTFVTIYLAACIMAYLPFAGRKVERQGGVLFIAVEGQSEIRVRVQAVIDDKVVGHLCDPLDIEHMPLAWIEACPKLSDPDAFEKLAAIIKPVAETMQQKYGLPLALIAIDTLSPAAQFKDANSSAEAQHVMSVLKKIAHTFQCFVMAVDHFGKNVDTGTRDSSVKESDVDTVLALLGERDLSGTVTNPRMAFRKVRGAPSGDVIPFRTRHIEVADLDAEGHEKIFGTLVVDFADKPEAVQAATKREQLPKALKIFKRALDNSLERFGIMLRPFFDGPQVKAVDRDYVRAEFLAAYPADNHKAKKEAFLRCESDAVARGIMCSREIDGVDRFWALT